MSTATLVHTHARYASVALAACWLGLAAGPARAQCPRTAELNTEDAAGFFDHFGSAVAVSGSVAVVGASEHDLAGWDSGLAYAYRSGDGGATWGQAQTLVPHDLDGFMNFGNAVAASGGSLVVGAWLDGEAAYNAGAAYVFVEDGTGWTELQKLTASDPDLGAAFGTALAADADVIVIGAPNDDANGFDAGAVYVFRFDGSGFVEEAKLVGDGSQARFGADVDIAGDVIIVGAEVDDDAASDAGAAFVFRHDGAGWTHEAKLVASDAATGDWFGASVSIGGPYALVGAPQGDAAAEGAGQAYLFEHDGEAWTEIVAVWASDTAGGDGFGGSVDLSGDLAVVGAPWADYDGGDTGASYVFRLDDLIVSDECKMTAPPGAENYLGFGASVSVDAGRIIAGGRGMACVFESDSGPVEFPEGDINHDTVVDVLDLIALIGSWGACDGGCAADLDGDGVVGVLDLVALFDLWN